MSDYRTVGLWLHTSFGCSGGGGPHSMCIDKGLGVLIGTGALNRTNTVVNKFLRLLLTLCTLSS